MAYTAKSDGAWIDKLATGGTATTNLVDAGDCNRWEANQADANSRLSSMEAAVVYRVIYSGSAYPARPTGVAAGYVEYVGPTQPTSWLVGDTWTQA